MDEVPADDPQKDVLVSYKEDYESIHGEGTINTFGGHAYDALSMVVMALEEIDEDLDTDEARAAVRDELEKIKNFAGTGGVFTMSPTDHLGMAPGSLGMIEIVDGKWTSLKYILICLIGSRRNKGGSVPFPLVLWPRGPEV